MWISPLFFSAAVLACCLFAGPLGRVLGAIDHPDGVRKHHGRPTPLVGGVALMVPLLAIGVLEMMGQPSQSRLFLALTVGGFGALALGWLDDRHHVAPNLRLLVSASLGVAVLLLEPSFQIRYIDLGAGAWSLGWLALPFTLLCLIGLLNAINMADGTNGLIICLSIIWTACLLPYAPPYLTFYLVLMLVGLCIMLPFNLRGRLFLGDAGSYAIGLTIGLLMIHVQGRAEAVLPMPTVVLWLLVPVLDCLRVMGSRLLAANSPFNADRNHLHHRLSRIWQWPLTLVIYVGLAGIPSLAAAVWPGATLAMLATAVAVYAGLIWVTRTTAALPSRFRPERGPLTSPHV